MRYEFGKNWDDYIRHCLSPERVAVTQKHLLGFLKLENLKGKTFLDVGCGSGIHSLAAIRAGADKVVGFDYDADSVAATNRVREREGNPANWSVMQGSVLDQAFMASLSPADIVYSWGVLHHTGDQWAAFSNCVKLIRPGGLFYVALYQRQPINGRSPEYWLDVKQRYNRAGPLGRRRMEAAYMLRYTVWPLKHRFLRHVRDYKKNRGMSYSHDVKDWLGGWPMDYSTVEEVRSHAEGGLHLRLENLATQESNAEYLLRRPA